MGVELVTTDGVAFRRADLPARVYIFSIDASGANSASVTLTDRRRYQTQDGGRTWNEF